MMLNLVLHMFLLLIGRTEWAFLGLLHLVILLHIFLLMLLLMLLLKLLLIPLLMPILMLLPILLLFLLLMPDVVLYNVEST